MQSLIYALIQNIHNIGAVTIVGVSVYGLFFAREHQKKLLAIVISFAWALQGISGAAFGVTTLYFYQQLPDIHGVAVAALAIKVACVILGFFVASSYVVFCTELSLAIKKVFWITLFFLGNIALSSAGYLRWFS